MSDTLSTSDVGITAAGVAYVYAAGGVTQVPRGSTITYGEWITSDAAAIGPGVYEMQSGSWQAANSGFIRAATITPLVL